MADEAVRAFWAQALYGSMIYKDEPQIRAMDVVSPYPDGFREFWENVLREAGYVKPRVPEVRHQHGVQFVA